jgi:hypothetical protein
MAIDDLGEQMKISQAVLVASLLIFLIAASGSTSFAQSDFAEFSGFGRAESSGLNLADVAALPVSPLAETQADAQSIEAAGNNLETTASKAADPTPKVVGRSEYSKIGIGVKVSTLGAGAEVATPLARKFNLRGGFNVFRYSRPITDSGIHYVGQLQFQSAEAHLDFFPLGGFHVSPGILFYNGNQISATAAVPGGQTFTTGGTTYESDPATPVNGSAKMSFVKVSPSLMVGIGNLIPRNGRHFSILFEAGAAYQGSARVALNLTGSVCDTTGVNCRSISSDPTVQANIQAQQVKIQKDVNPYRFYPVVSIGFGFNFF